MNSINLKNEERFIALSANGKEARPFLVSMAQKLIEAKEKLTTVDTTNEISTDTTLAQAGWAADALIAGRQIRTVQNTYLFSEAASVAGFNGDYMVFENGVSRSGSYGERGDPFVSFNFHKEFPKVVDTATIAAELSAFSKNWFRWSNKNYVVSFASRSTLGSAALSCPLEVGKRYYYEYQYGTTTKKGYFECPRYTETTISPDYLSISPTTVRFLNSGYSFYLIRIYNSDVDIELSECRIPLWVDLTTSAAVNIPITVAISTGGIATSELDRTKYLIGDVRGHFNATGSGLYIAHLDMVRETPLAGSVMGKYGVITISIGNRMNRSVRSITVLNGSGIWSPLVESTIG